MNKILIVGDDVATKLLIAKMLKQLGEEMIVDRPSNVFEITIPKGYNERIETNYTPDREHGWYRKFEKNGKKRNFKKAI